MCPGSPVSMSIARAALKQAVERVDAGRMSITPLNLEPVRTDEANAERPNVERYGRGIEKRSAAHLLHAGRTGTRQPQRPRRIEAFMAVLIPFDLQSVVLAIDGVRYGVHVDGYWLMAENRKPPGHRRVSGTEELMPNRGGP
jgi:hypothetical protein